MGLTRPGPVLSTSRRNNSPWFPPWKRHFLSSILSAYRSVAVSVVNLLRYVAASMGLTRPASMGLTRPGPVLSTSRRNNSPWFPPWKRHFLSSILSAYRSVAVSLSLTCYVMLQHQWV
ncbi:hypothetical protein J6590_043364 [Homalodisca vitripennis]|nr:hypothetical protein J6590_043364 [Homalodisca vitripennis]